MHGAAATKLVGGGRRDAGRRGATAGLQRLPREEGFEDFLGAPVLLHETWVLKRGGMGDLGGGWLEHPRPWLGAQWVGLFLRVPSCPEPPGAP